MEKSDLVMIQTEGVTKRFGDFVAVDHVDFGIKAEETVGVIGPNGAGKTTFLNLLTGYYPPEEGRISYRGKDITSISPEKRVAFGIIRTFQLVRVFDNLSVQDNLGLSYYRKKEQSPFPIRMFFSHLAEQGVQQKVEETLEMFELSHLSNEWVGNLSLGSKRRLELAMAFIADPAVLALDEPFAGLGDLEIDEVLRVFKKYSHQKTILIVEHKISKLMDIVDRLAVMHEGRIVANGPPRETLEDPEVRRVYWKVEK
ncbi:MAG: ABC transporter ATP-binding protein [Deltaproteobacteria bacterium]|nr:MAG: ABC transporter ATP-binding protein [Deltaproteobacteria bacterium]